MEILLRFIPIEATLVAIIQIFGGYPYERDPKAHY